MKLAPVLWVVMALFLHGSFVAFGGIFFLGDEQDQGSLAEVDLLVDEDLDQDEEQDEQTPPEQPPEQPENEAEDVPSAEDIARSLELAPQDDAPALDAASLSAIEQALSGAGVAGDFAEALSFTSGGRLGGTGKGTALAGGVEDAFSLAEIDQEPRLVFSTLPIYPTEMRGKKVEGVVSVIFVVDENGRVQHAKIEKSNHSAFEKPALDAVRQWKFEPGLKGGQPVACRKRAPIRFPSS